MKKYIAGLFALILLISASSFAYADVVWLNEFFEENRAKLQNLNRNWFCANGAEGFVSERKEPGSDTLVMSEFENGKTLFLDRVYSHEGEYWGVMSPGHGSYTNGWFRMDDLLVIYTVEDFVEENEDKFYPYDGGYSSIKNAEKFVLWEWPGSDREKRVIQNIDILIHSISSNGACIDKEGREWVNVAINFNYNCSKSSIIMNAPPLYWTLNGWVYIENPVDAEIPAFYPAPEPLPWSPDSLPVWPPPDNSIRPASEKPDRPVKPDGQDKQGSKNGNGSTSGSATDMKYVIIITVALAIVLGAAISIVVLRKVRKGGRVR